MTVLSLVAHVENEKQARAVRIDALQVDRTRYLGSAGKEIERRLEPLDDWEQAYKDRADEKVRAAKADTSISIYDVRRQLFALGTG